MTSTDEIDSNVYDIGREDGYGEGCHDGWKAGADDKEAHAQAYEQGYQDAVNDMCLGAGADQSVYEGLVKN